MRDDWIGAPRRRTPRLTFALILINVAAYIITQLPVFYDDPRLEIFALSRAGLERGYVWQLLTFQFLHAPLHGPLSLQTLLSFDIPWHLLLNCWGIYVFGPPVEVTLGRRSFLSLYFLSGGCGGLLQILASLLAHEHFGRSVVGASAGLFGLVAAFTSLYPDTRMTVLLFFVIPLRMTANTLLIVAALISVVGMVLSLGNIAHAAHLGGLIAGLAFVRWKLWRRTPPRLGG
jgi:membrane associated rhomboid family serine protease